MGLDCSFIKKCGNSVFLFKLINLFKFLKTASDPKVQNIISLWNVILCDYL